MPAMTKKKKVIGCLVIPIAFIVICVLIFSLLFLSGSKEIEITENHPFKSAGAKEQYLSFMKEHEKQSWPIDSEKVTVNTSFGETFVRISGPESAPPLVLLHGMGASSLSWGMNIEALSNDYRTYAVDTVGDYGLSVCTNLLQSADDYLLWLDELFTGLNLNRNINLMGMSFGASVAAHYAVGHQDRLNKVVLLAGGIGKTRKQADVRAIISLLPFKSTKGLFTSWLLEEVKEKDEALFKRIVEEEEIGMQCFKTVSGTYLGALNDQELKKLNIPILFLAGENERLFSPNKVMEHLEKIAPSIQKRLIPNVGHFLTSMQTELVNSVVLQFLNEELDAKKQK